MYKNSVITELEKQLKPANLRLEQPSQALYESFLAFVEDMRSHNQPLWNPYLPKKDETPEQFVNRLRQREINPEKPFVPETIYWAIFDNHVVGRISLRHKLEGNLHKVGGHIGYEVSPKWRKRGFATEMLRLMLGTPKAKEIGNVLLTCSPHNEASNKTILKNGGVFDKTIFVDFLNEERIHYWITNLKDNFKIELARQHEVPTITKLVNAAYKELADKGLNYTATYQDDDKTKERISNGRCFVLKDSSDKILGTILMTVENYFTNSNTAYLGQLGILPEFKKNGFGTMLMEYCENLAMKEGFSGIQLDTAIPAKHLVDWYQHRGYKIVGQEHYEGKTYDSYVFEKTFSS